MKSFRSSCSAAAAACLALFTLADAQAQTSSPPKPTAKSPQRVNEAGQIIQSDVGTRRLYQQSELLRLRPAAMRATGATDQSPLRPWKGVKAFQGASSSWAFAAYGSGIGSSGILLARNGAHTEIYAGGSSTTFGANQYWYAVQYDAASNVAQQVYVSDLAPGAILRLALARRGTTASPRIAVALVDGSVLEYDQPTKKLLGRAQGPCIARGGLNAFNTADLNGDGVDEYLAICGDQTLFAYGAQYRQWSLAGVGGTELVAANMDGDPAIEIATTSGRVVDGASHAVQWHWPQQFGVHIRTTDINADGRADVIAADQWGLVNAFDVSRQKQSWSISTPQDIGAIEVADVDGDGVAELLVGDGQWGEVKAYTIATQALKGRIHNPEHGVTNIAAGDLTGDGVPELLWGAGATSTGSDHLYIADWASRKIQWQNDDLQGPFLGPVTGDLDGDGKPEVVFVSTSSDSAYNSGRIIVLDGNSLAIRAISAPVADNFAWTGVHDIKLRDLNHSGRMSILISADWLYDGQLEAYSFSANNKFTRTWTNASRPDGAFHSVDAADLDGDGTMEIVGGGANSMYAYDLTTGNEKWRSPQLSGGGAISVLALADLDADGSLEVAGMLNGGNIYVLDGKTYAVEALILGEWTAMSTKQGPRGSQLLLGSSSGRVGLYEFNGSGYDEIAGQIVTTGPIDGLRQKAGKANGWVGSQGVVRHFVEGVNTFETAYFGSGFGRNMVLARGGKLLLSGGSYGVFGFVVKR